MKIFGYIALAIGMIASVNLVGCAVGWFSESMQFLDKFSFWSVVAIDISLLILGPSKQLRCCVLD